MSTAGNKHTDGGSTPRSYLDSTVVPTLLEGLKLLATERYVFLLYFSSLLLTIK